jgi:O-acetyl-ADP-ribose deacetylase (regulator of RNase III)
VSFAASSLLTAGDCGFPLERTARIAVWETLGFLGENEKPGRMIFVCFGAATAAHYHAVLKGAA